MTGAVSEASRCTKEMWSLVLALELQAGLTDCDDLDYRTFELAIDSICYWYV